MKSFIKIIFIFLATTIFLLSNPTSLQAQPTYSTGAIQKVQTETVELVANNMLDINICENIKEETTTYSGEASIIISQYADTNYLTLIKNTDNKSFIHNLSTNKQKVHQIRAP